MNTKAVLLTHGLMMVIFLVIALVSVGMILAPSIDHIKGYDPLGGGQVEFKYAAPATSVYGLVGRVETWKTYPEYNIGFGVVAGLAFSGSVLMCWTMYNVKNRLDNALQSNSRAV